MLNAGKNRAEARERRRRRVRRKIRGTDARPRLCVTRSLSCTYAQLISDESGEVLGAASSRDLVEKGKSAKTVESAKALGGKIAELAKEKNISTAVFDRNGYLYHGRVAAVADGAREQGLAL